MQWSCPSRPSCELVCGHLTWRSMDDYDRLWASISRSPLAGVYVSELHWLARSVEDGINGIFDDTPSGQDYLRVDHALHGRILSVLLNAARIRALLLDRGGRGPRDRREGLP